MCQLLTKENNCAQLRFYFYWSTNQLTSYSNVDCRVSKAKWTHKKCEWFSSKVAQIFIYASYQLADVNNFHMKPMRWNLMKTDRFFVACVESANITKILIIMPFQFVRRGESASVNLATVFWNAVRLWSQ